MIDVRSPLTAVASLHHNGNGVGRLFDAIDRHCRQSGDGNGERAGQEGAALGSARHSAPPLSGR